MEWFTVDATGQRDKHIIFVQGQGWVFPAQGWMGASSKQTPRVPLGAIVVNENGEMAVTVPISEDAPNALATHGAIGI